jgi:hypothetical protein
MTDQANTNPENPESGDQTTETTINAATSPENDTAITTDSTGIENSGVWYLSENVVGEGDKPEFFNEAKYKNINEQLKAQKELEKKLGGFTGAPEEYDLSTFSKHGFEANAESPLIEGFIQEAKKLNVSQEAFNTFVKYHAEHIKSLLPDPAKELEKLGPWAKQEMAVLDQWAQNNLTAEEANVFKSMATKKEHIDLFKKLRSLTTEKKIPNGGNGGVKLTKEKMEQMIMDDRYTTDPAYRQDVQQQIQLSESAA